MIRIFRHKGLESYFCAGKLKGIPSQYEPKIRRILDRLDTSNSPMDMDIIGFKFHELKGNRKGTYAVSVSGNWRITFKFEDVDAINVNLEDYH
jgi:proteic killer suppression protein